jgi:signal transduction histidine kinase
MSQQIGWAPPSPRYGSPDPYHNKVDTHPRSHIALWACRIGLPEPLGVLVVATLLPKPLEAEFMNGVAHELRTPLSVINGYLSMLDDGTFGPVPQASRPDNALEPQDARAWRNDRRPS